MADEDKDTGDAGENEGDGQEEKPDQKTDDKNIDAGDLAEMTKKLASMEELVNKQQAVIKKFQELGNDKPVEKTDQERIQELESTLELFKTKMEAEQQAKAQAAKQKREQAVEALIKQVPEFKEMRDTLMKVDDTVLAMFSKHQEGITPNPVSRAGITQSGNADWSKKLAAAADRRKKHNEILQNIKY